MQRLRRTMLFVPGGNEKLAAKALEMKVDALIFDLEDAVRIEKKAEAREHVSSLLKTKQFGRKEKVVRVNSLGTGFWEDDLEKIISSLPDTILFPKVEKSDDIVRYEDRISRIEERMNLPRGKIEMMALIESPLGVLNAFSIASASSRMNGLHFGAADFTRETGGKITPSRMELHYPMMQVLVAARATKINAVDTPYFDINDPEGLERHSIQARDMGYDGKAVIHPGQIEIVNRCFTPTAQEVEFARKVIAAFEQAKAEGRGAIQVDGKLVEILHVQMAQRVLKTIESLGKDS
jgi:citrate lyase subunit beta/citryl-CoA lyase